MEITSPLEKDAQMIANPGYITAQGQKTSLEFQWSATKNANQYMGKQRTRLVKAMS